MKFKESSLKENIADINSTAQYCTDPNYTYWHALTTPWRGRRVVKILSDYFSPKAKILDVGCSQGMTIGYTAQVFPKIIGVDIDKDALKTARERLQRLGVKARLTWYNGKKLPFKNNIFDGVVTSEVFEHVDDPKLFIKEISRVTKPGGKLIISAPNKLYPIECEFHLPFLSYLPRPMADVYVRLSGKGNSYDHVNHPTYLRINNTVGEYFKIDDITLKIIKNANKYFLTKERGVSAVQAARLLNIIEKYNNTFLEPFFSLIEKVIIQVVPGWILVGTKKK